MASLFAIFVSLMHGPIRREDAPNFLVLPMMVVQVDRSVAQAKELLEAALVGGTTEPSPVKVEGFSAGAGSSNSPAINGKRPYFLGCSSLPMLFLYFFLRKQSILMSSVYSFWQFVFSFGLDHIFYLS